MTLLQWIVTGVGLMLIGLVNYHFFRASRSASAAAVHQGIQRLTVIVDGGYQPAELRVRAGVPVRIDFLRRDRGSCTDEVVLADFGVRRFLPPGQTTSVQFTPMHPGSFGFSCGMGMLHGKLVVAE